MKKNIAILITCVVISLAAFSQSASDYRSIASGNWNDLTKWETYNGSNWVSATSYPGQNPGTGAVEISAVTQIAITASVPFPVTGLSVAGILTFSSANAISLHVSGVYVSGALMVDNQNGAKSHTLFIGGDLVVGTTLYDPTTYCPPYDFIPGTFQTISQDDKLSIVFNSSVPTAIDAGWDGIEFQDVTFDGAAFIVSTPIFVMQSATFTNGIITTSPYLSPRGAGTYNADCGNLTYSGNTTISFGNGATASGASNTSFVDGIVTKLGNNSFTFPIGKGNVYSPLTISAPSDPAASITARYLRSNASDLGPVGDLGLFGISNCEYWNLDGLDNNYPLDVTVGWSAASGCGSSPYVTDVSEVTLAHFDYATGVWDSHAGLGVGTAASGYITRQGVSRSGSFTFGNLSSACDAPGGQSATNISLNSATLNWSSVSNSASYDVDYKPYTSGQWINVATATTSTSVNLSALDAGMYYDWRIRSNCSLSSSSYRQAQFQTLCGAASGLTTPNITTASATLSWSPFSNYVTYNVEYKQSTSNTWIVAATGISSTFYTLNGLITGTTYDWRVVINCTLSGQGNYAQASFTTFSCGTPTGLLTANVNTGSATVSWAPVANAVSYDVGYKQSTSNSWTVATSTNSPSYNITGLSASTSYDWRVRVNCNQGPGSYAQASFTTAICNDVYETNNVFSQATTINLGTMITANIASATDVDWFKATMPNNSYTTLQVVLNNLPADYDLYVYNKNLALVASSASTGTMNEFVVYSSKTRNATYYIKVIGKNGSYSAGQCYNLLAQAVGSPRSITSTSSDRNRESTEGSSDQVLYPNPASEFVYLRFNSAAKEISELQIENSVGQLVTRYPVNISIGYNLIRIPAHDLSPGMYILRMMANGINTASKFVILR